jgi:Domain of unknown function (DUF4349)
MPATDPIGSGEYKGLVDELRATPPVAPERLRQRVLELAPAPRRRASRRRRLVLVAVPLAAALAVGAALVHGFVSSGSRPRAASLSSSVLGLSQNLAAAPATKAATAASGAAKATHEKALGTLQAQRQAATPAVPTNRLVHADASLSVRVADGAALSRATSRATAIVTRLGGYAKSVRYASSHDGSGSAYLALRVPVAHVKTALARLGALGAILSQQLSTQDLQQQVTKASSKITKLRATIATYRHALQDPSLPAAQRVILQARLANERKTLTQTRQARSGALASAATANVSLTLTTKQHTSAATPTHRGRFDRMLGSATGFLGLEGMIVLYALVVLSPVLVIGGLGWALVRERRRRNERHLLASS